MTYPLAESSSQSPEQSRSWLAPIFLPRVNVIVSCFNQSAYVGQSLDSVAAQTYRDFDCVVVDDASTDASVKAVDRWLSAVDDPRFRLVRGNAKRGRMASFAVGLAVCQGEFAAFLDAGDVWLPHFLQRHIEVHLNRHCIAGVTCSDLVHIDDERKGSRGSTNSLERSTRDDGRPLTDGENSKSKLETAEVKYLPPGLGWYRGVTSGMMFRRALLALVMPREPGRPRIGADDYLMLLSHYFTGSLVIGDAPSGYHRHGKDRLAASLQVANRVSPFSAIELKHRNMLLEAVLLHLLECYEELATAFSAARVSTLIRLLFRECLRLGIPINDQRLRRVLGSGRILRDQARVKLASLRGRSSGQTSAELF